ncbi:MAG: DUF1080 domain-containing protein [Bacteroidaceae bacterium]|nr:DUF1080 domain-containing protein [Bacteroidaceae bacterium]
MRRIMNNCLLAGTIVLASMFLGEQQMQAQTLTPENQLIYLRHIMEQAQTAQEKNATMLLIGQTGTMQAMMYAQKYLQDKTVKKTAAKAVKAIASTHPEYNEFVSLFNGKDLTGWKGLVENPIKRAKMSESELAEAQKKADEIMCRDWTVEDGCLTYVGHGFENICTIKNYKDFEMTCDWKLDPNGKEPDAGVYLRGTPQVQIWDIRRTNVGAQVGSGGLYNNKENESKPLSVQDNKLGEWNTFYIKMVGDKVTVKLNGTVVVDNVTLENYWDRSQPIFPSEQIEMQAHGSKVYFRDIFIREL